MGQKTNTAEILQNVATEFLKNVGKLIKIENSSHTHNMQDLLK